MKEQGRRIEGEGRRIEGEGNSKEEINEEDGGDEGGRWRT